MNPSPVIASAARRTAPALSILLLLTVLGLLLGPGLVGAALDGRRALAISYRPAAVELVDLDGDQVLDLVTVSTGEFSGGQWNGCEVHVFLNPGSGEFDAATVYQVPAAPSGLAVADLDGDQDDDLVTPNAAPDNLQILLNDGAGGFTHGAVVPVSGDPRGVVAIDLDGDGDADLASADQFGFGVSVAFNNGDATFGLAQFYALGDLINGIQAGDVDHDQDADLIAFGNNGARLLRNPGTGVFGPAEDLGLGGVSARTQLRRLDDDDHLDLVSGGSVWRGNGDGTFATPPVPTGLPAADHVRCVDFDGDGWRDVVTGAGVARGDGLGGLYAPLGFDPPPDSGPIAVGDFGGDAIVDLVRLQGGVAGPIGFATLLPGVGGGAVPLLARFPGGDSVWELDIADVGGDDHLDLLVANIGTAGFLNGSVAVLHGNGDGSLAPLVSYPAGDYVRTVRAADLSGDTAPELVATNFGDATAGIFPNDGAGNFGPRQPQTTGSNPEAVTFADFDGDQQLDIAITNYGLGATAASVCILFGDGLGGVASSATIDLTGHAAVDIVAADLDADQAPDLAIACAGRYYGGGWTHFGLYVLLNAGDGTFLPETHHPSSYLPRTLNAGDVNGDLATDLILTSHGPTPNVLLEGEVLTFLNDGNGSFPAAVVTPLTHDHFSAGCEDLNGDGQLDLVVPYLSAAVVSLLWGDGSGGFPTQTHYATAGEPRAVVLGDLNHDDQLDLAIAHSLDNDVGILLGASSSAGIAAGGGGDRSGGGRLEIRNFPNPFNPSTRLQVDLPAVMVGQPLRLQIFDVNGRLVGTPWRGRASSARVEVEWDGRGRSGQLLATGVYLVRMAGAGGGSVPHKMVLLRASVRP